MVLRHTSSVMRALAAVQRMYPDGWTYHDFCSTPEGDRLRLRSSKAELVSVLVTHCIVKGTAKGAARKATIKRNLWVYPINGNQA